MNKAPFLHDVMRWDWGMGTLLCQHCGYDYMHQFEVQVFERGEDQANGLAVTVNGHVTVHKKVGHKDGNPSYRRQGVRILCWCESCVNVTAIHIVQHKGVTYLEAHRSDRKAPQEVLNDYLADELLDDPEARG